MGTRAPTVTDHNDWPVGDLPFDISFNIRGRPERSGPVQAPELTAGPSAAVRRSTPKSTFP